MEEVLHFVDKYNWKKDPFFNPIPVGFNIIGFDMIIINSMQRVRPTDEAKSTKDLQQDPQM